MNAYQRLRRSANYHLINGGLDLLRYSGEASLQFLTGTPEPVRILLVSDGAEYTSEMQYAPFCTYRRELRRQLGVASIHTDWEAAHRLLGLFSFAVVGIKVGFRVDDQRVRALVEKIRPRLNGARLVYFDGDDDLNFQRPWILDQVDLAVKKHVYRDSSDYAVPRVGKSNLTDYVVRNHGQSFDDDIIPESAPVPRERHDRIHLGWNIALDYKMTDLFGELGDLSGGDRPTDVLCRAPADPSWWIYPLRSGVSPALESLRADYRIHTPIERVDQRSYYAELQASKICISPFGYGEICWRDFEAILSGCLLVKPDVGHLRTSPDLFVPYETYVPVRWDYSDLAVTCEYYLRDEAERDRIAENAWSVLTSYYRESRFVDDVAQLLGCLGISVAPSGLPVNS